MVHFSQLHAVQIASFLAALLFGASIAIVDWYKRRRQNPPFGIRLRTEPEKVSQPEAGVAWGGSANKPQTFAAGRVAILPHVDLSLTPTLPVAALCPMLLPIAKAVPPSRRARGFSELEITWSEKQDGPQEVRTASDSSRISESALLQVGS